MRLRRHLVALAALAGLAVASPAQASEGVPILTKFQPVLVFHPGEELRPTTVETFVRDANLEAATSPTSWIVVNGSPTADDLPAASPPVWRLNQRACFAGAPLGDLACYVAGAADEPGVTVYGRLVRDEQRIVLQYWLFYYDNLYRYPFLPLGTIWQSHEGDWEVVNVVLSNAKRPLAVGLSQHCAGETRPWSETELREGHPVAYVALGSHASYFEPGLHEFDRACLPSPVIAFFEQAGLPLPADVAARGPGGRPEAPRPRARRARAGVRRLAELGRLPRVLGRAPVLQRAVADRNPSLRHLACRPRVPRDVARAAGDAGDLALTF